MDVTEQSGSPASPVRPRIQYACEACRIAKVKCTPGDTAAICRRCSMSKRECIFKTGPRTRRRRSKLHPAATRKTPPPSAPSKTFTIDVPMSTDDDADMEPSDSVDALRDAHEAFIDDLVPEDGPGGHSRVTVPSSQPQSSASGRAFSSSTPSVTSRSAHGFSSVQPQFNLDAAASLLESFREGMLPHFPVVLLSPDATVPSLARDRPFVLLAILAAASGGRSLQGHSLYDEEFRKVLGLKFVSGGERSLELLAGLLIYCVWYPFHLRPKNRQALQYIRMAADIVHDLDLDQAPRDENLDAIKTDQGRMAGIRAYLACYYLCSSFASIWAKSHSMPYQQWTASCCEILESSTEEKAATSDQTLAWLVRLGHIGEETLFLIKGQRKLEHKDQHTLLMIKGLEAQLGEWRSQMPPSVSTQRKNIRRLIDALLLEIGSKADVSQAILRMANMFTEIGLYGYPLLKFPNYTSQKRGQTSPDYYADPSRLLVCTNSLRNWYDYIACLPESEFANFASTDWARLVVTVILGLRLSFPLPNECPGWDHGVARGILDLGSFLHGFSGPDSGSETLTPSSSNKSSKSDVLSASKVVLGVVERKYEKRLAALERAAAMEPPHPVVPDAEKELHKCPMFDGSLDPYIEMWDDSLQNATAFASPPHMAPMLDAGSMVGGRSGSAQGMQPMIFHDLWATMTMGWSQEGFEDIDFGNI